MPGFLQTADYARAILAVGPDTMEDELEQMVAARIERQAILDRPRPPVLLAVLDEAVLHRGRAALAGGRLRYIVFTWIWQHVTTKRLPHVR